MFLVYLWATLPQFAARDTLLHLGPFGVALGCVNGRGVAVLWDHQYEALAATLGFLVM